MADQFYVARGSKRLGPFSAAQLKAFAAEGQIRPTDPIWREGMANPVPANKVKNLFPDPPAPADIADSGAVVSELSPPPPAPPAPPIEQGPKEEVVPPDPAPLAPALPSRPADPDKAREREG